MIGLIPNIPHCGEYWGILVFKFPIPHREKFVFPMGKIFNIFISKSPKNQIFFDEIAWKLSKFFFKNVNGWQNNYSLSINWAFKVKRSYLTIRKSSPHFSPFPMGKNFPSPLFPIPHGEKIRWGYVNPSCLCLNSFLNRVTGVSTT